MTARGVSNGKAGRPGDSRCTPESVWKPVLRAIEYPWFDLDPCTNSFATVPSAFSYSLERGEDGLEMPWKGQVWVNPPFSDISPWAKKAVRSISHAEAVWVLTPGDSSTRWWQHLAEHASFVVMWKNRPHFPRPGHPKGSPPGPIHVFCITGAEQPYGTWANSLQREGHTVMTPWG